MAIYNIEVSEIPYSKPNTHDNWITFLFDSPEVRVSEKVGMWVDDEVVEINVHN